MPGRIERGDFVCFLPVGGRVGKQNADFGNILNGLGSSQMKRTHQTLFLLLSLPSCLKKPILIELGYRIGKR